MRGEVDGPRQLTGGPGEVARLSKRPCFLQYFFGIVILRFFWLGGGHRGIFDGPTSIDRRSGRRRRKTVARKCVGNRSTTRSTLPTDSSSISASSGDKESATPRCLAASSGSSASAAIPGRPRPRLLMIEGEKPLRPRARSASPSSANDAPRACGRTATRASPY